LQNKQATNPIINNETNDNRAVAQGDGLGRGSEPYDCWCNHNDRRDGRTTHVEQAVELGASGHREADRQELATNTVSSCIFESQLLGHLAYVSAIIRAFFKTVDCGFYMISEIKSCIVDFV